MEKYPLLFESRFGIEAYGYWEGCSAAQIDLMVMDCPVIDYGKKKSDGKRSMILTESEKDEMSALEKEWNEDRQGMSYVGKTFSLNEFMRGEVK